MDLADKPKPSAKEGDRALNQGDGPGARAADVVVSAALGAVAEVVTAGEHRNEVGVWHFARNSRE
jgi:hypothetical protein